MVILKKIILLSLLLLINNPVTGMELNRTTILVGAAISCVSSAAVYLYKNPTALNDAKIFLFYMGGDNDPLMHALVLAGETPNLPRFEYLLRYIGDVSQLQLSDTCSLVDYACTRNTLDFIKFLIDKKGIQLSSNHIYQGLRKACSKAKHNKTLDLSHFEYWIHQIINVDEIDLDIPLMTLYLKKGGIVLVKKLLEKGFQLKPYHKDVINIRLEALSKKKDLSELTCWVNNIADIDGIDLNEPLINICSRTDELNLVKKLVQKGADINYNYDLPIASLSPRTPLGIAIQHNNVDGVNFLLSQKVKISPVYVACAAGNENMTFFVAQYANLQDSMGKTALHYPGVITKIISSHSFNCPSIIVSGDRNKIRHLLINGADPEIKNKNGQTAYDLTNSQEEGEILKDKKSAREKVVMPCIQQHIHKPGDGNLNIAAALRNREYSGGFTKRIAY